MLPVKQYRQKSGLCGVASFKMVLDYFGLSASERKLTELTGANSQKGTSAAGLKKAACALGLDFLLKDEADFNDIKFYLDQKIPLILNWFSMYNDYAEGHYSVAVGLDKKFIYLQDPEIAGVRKMKREDFKRVWFDFEGDFMKNNNDLILRRLIVIKPRN